MNERITRELRRLQGDLSDVVPPGGVGTVRFRFATTLEPEAVVGRAKEILMIVDREIPTRRPSVAKWSRLLPGWFVQACAPEMAPEQQATWLAAWRASSEVAKAALEAEEAWTLAGWLHWMSPSERQWWWWSAEMSPHPVVTVEVDAWPFPWGALSWLLRAAGATSVVSEGW